MYTKKQQSLLTLLGLQQRLLLAKCPELPQPPAESNKMESFEHMKTNTGSKIEEWYF